MESSHFVFAYGTLQIPEVIKLVAGQVFPSQAARLNGYQRLKIKHRTYPGIIEDPNQFIEGVLYSNVDPASLTLLDQFEDILYERRLVSIESAECQAFVYVIKDEYKGRLSDEEWSLEEFKQKYLGRYLKAISKW